VRPFEFIGVIYSVVLGVAVAQLMTGVARLIEERQRVRNYWVHSAWIAAVLLGDIGNWWSMWSVRDAKSWHLVTFLLLIALTGAIFLMTVLLFPRTSDVSETVDLRAHYYANSAIFLRANAAAWALALFCNWSLYPVDTWFDPWLSIPAAVVVLSLVVAQTKRPITHGIFSVTVLLAMVVMLLLQGVRIT
jgi:hypothetical protein